MPLDVGERLGPYEVLAPLGAGGMGEVYKARDTRLDRSVAVKVLPDHIAQREDARARFEREARAVASLNHPHICTLHDIGPNYMVMELIEGETLAARIEKGPIPLEQALGFATQITDALDRAHRAGVTHRDVKPQNIMLTRDGVKVLDFGLAKSASSAPGPTEATLTKALTTEGTVLGTPQYMAPEQFEGKEADARSDIWAFGAVLYEMVTGRKAFEGKSYTSLVGAILGSDPPPMALKPFTPAGLDRLVRRCLRKEPDDRYQSMRDLVIDLKSPPAEIAATPTKSGRWPWVAGCLAALLLALAAVHFREAPPEQPVLTTSINPPENAPFNQVAISPDGKLLAFTAMAEGKRQLWVRPLAASAAQPLPGTDGAEFPFWSPGSRWIGFFAANKLKKIEASGGPAQTLCDATAGRGGTWNAEGVILFSQGVQGIFRVAPDSGTPMPATTLDRVRGEGYHRWPVFLPGGRRFLYSVYSTDRNVSGIYAGSLDTKERVRLTGDTVGPGYAEGSAGESYLLFVRAGTLMAQRFDVERSALSGDAFPVAERVEHLDARGWAAYSISGNGMLVFSDGSPSQVQIAWANREGKRLEAIGALGKSTGVWPALSPDEKKVAFVDATTNGSDDIWVRDLALGVQTRFTFYSGLDWAPVWSPDGGSIAYTSLRNPSELCVKSASGAGPEALLLKAENLSFAADWGAGGRLLLYYERHPKTGYDLWVLPMEGQRKPQPFLRTEFDERGRELFPGREVDCLYLKRVRKG
ncbi:MAG: protein kinase [Bryobacteraceae bacterium]